MINWIRCIVNKVEHVQPGQFCWRCFIDPVQGGFNEHPVFDWKIGKRVESIRTTLWNTVRVGDQGTIAKLMHNAEWRSDNRRGYSVLWDTKECTFSTPHILKSSEPVLDDDPREQSQEWLEAIPLADFQWPGTGNLDDYIWFTHTDGRRRPLFPLKDKWYAWEVDSDGFIQNG